MTRIHSKAVAALSLALSLNVCTVNAAEWKPLEQTIVTSLLVADWGQTRDIARRDDLIEAWNPILGTHPSVGDVDKYFAASIVLYNLAAYHLPPKWSRRMSYVVGVVQVTAIGNNLGLGVKFDF